ncbi:hypothetical protein ACT3TS_14130 [Specibacter sp. AOP5-B1-6]|uniref:hypothetical protein n=1 Tax=Specibacter sp. AOP5-B1-6 TaxID=3457653 RepID=UPI00402BA0D5
MTRVRYATVVIAVMVFVVGVVLGLTIPVQESYWWLMFVVASIIVLCMVGKYGKNRPLALTVIEVISQLMTTFVGGLITAQLALGIGEAKRAGVEGFWDVASQLLIDRGLLLGLMLLAYGLMFVIQFASLDYVEKRRLI